MAVLAIVLVGVFQSQSQSLSMAGRSRFLTTASLLAQSRMTEVEAAGIENVTGTSGNFGEDYPDYSWRIELADTAMATIKKVTVRVVNRNLAINNEYALIYYTGTKK